MQQLAWLHAVPKAPDGKGKGDDRTRLERLRDQEVEPEMPEVRCCRYLLDYLVEVGPGMPGAMGAVPLTFGEIDAWCRRTGIDLDPWESRTLRALSAEYVHKHEAFSDRGEPAPWDGGEVDLRAELLAREMKDEMRRMASS